MSQSDKSDPKKPNNLKLVVEESEPTSEGPPSSDTTEEVVSAVNKFFGISRDPSKNDVSRRVGSDPKEKEAVGSGISKEAVAGKNAIQQTDDSETQRQAGSSKASDAKDIQSPSSKSVRDANSGRIWTKSNPARQVEQKQQVLDRPILKPTESVISAVTQFFSIGGDEKPAQKKKIADIRKDQIVATSKQVVDSSGSSNEVRKQASTSKVLESQPSTLTTKQKASAGISIKNDDITSSTNISKTILYGSSTDLKDGKKPESQISSGRLSKDPTESVVSAVTQYFGIGSNKPSETQKITTGQNKQITATAQEAIEKEDSQSKVPVSNPVIFKNRSQAGIETYNDGKVSRRLTEAGETSFERVTNASGSTATPSESVAGAVTDFFGVSQNNISAPGPTDQSIYISPVSPVALKEPQTLRNVETPRRFDEQNDLATTKATDAEVSPSSIPVRSIVQASPTNNDGPILAATTVEPQAVRSSISEIPQTIHEQKQPATAKALDSKISHAPVSPSKGVLPAPTAVERSSSRVDIPRIIDKQKHSDGRQPDTPMTQDSQAAPSPVSAVTSTPIVISKQESKKSGIDDKVVPAGEVGTGTSNGIAAKIPATPKPEESRIVASNKGIDPRAVVIQKHPTTGREVEDNESPSSSIKTAVTPDDTPIDRPGGASLKGDSGEDSGGHSQPMVGAAVENPSLVRNLSETPRTLNEPNTVVPTKVDTDVHPRHVTVVSESSAGPHKQLSATTSGKLQTGATNKSEISRILNEAEKGGPAKADSSAAQSSIISATKVPPLAMNAQDAFKNKDKRLIDPRDQTAVESQTTADTKSSVVSAAVPQQPALTTTHAAETARTGEGQRPVQPTIIPRSTVSSGPVVGPPPPHVSAPDRRQNDMINTSNTDEPSPPLQPNGSATGSRAMPDALGIIPIRGSHTSTATARQCWICFASDEDEMGMLWIQPCKCKGTTKWVHQRCLQMWVDEKLREHKDKKVACPQCRTEYLIYLPKANILVRSLDQVDNVIYRICPFVAAGVVIGSFYWNAVTYGAIVMLQVAGSENASVVAETFQPTVIIVGLPFIPLSLIVFRLFQWEDSFLYILRTTAHCVPFLQYILPGHVVNETGLVPDVPPTGIMSFQRVLAGALLTPVIAEICGNLFFPKVASPGWRTLSGGALFVSVKGLIKMYHKQQNYKRLSRRKILDYTDENKKLIEQTGAVMINQVVPTPLRFQFVASVEDRRN